MKSYQNNPHNKCKINNKEVLSVLSDLSICRYKSFEFAIEGDIKSVMVISKIWKNTNAMIGKIMN